MPATILVVDDDDMLLDLTSQVLEMSGYGVRTATSGPDALGLLGDGIDLVLVDATLKGALDGFALNDRIAEAQPGLPVLLMSGYGARAAETAGRPEIAVLKKPCPLDVLRAAIDAALAR